MAKTTKSSQQQSTISWGEYASIYLESIERTKLELRQIDWEMQMTLSEKQRLFGQNVTRLLAYIGQQDYSFTFGEALRTQEQADIYAKSGKGITHSLHIKKLAIDLNIFSPGGIFLTEVKDLEKFGKYWESLNTDNTWGGRWHLHPDSDHYQCNDNL